MTAPIWIKTKYVGVFERESTERLFQNKPDRCFYAVYKKNGKRIWEKCGWLSEGYNAKLASTIRSERLRSIRHKEELPQERKAIPYLKDIARKYLEWSKHNKKSYPQDENRYRLHLKPRFDNKRLDEITSFDLERLKTDLSNKGLSPQSIKHCVRLMGVMYNKVRDWGLYSGNNPVSQVKMPKVRNERLRFLSFVEADQLLNHLWNNKRTKNLHDMTLLSLFTGCRAGEVFNLRGRDINFETGLIAFIDTKNGTTRYVPMSEKVREMLWRRMPGNINELVFQTKKNEKIKEVSRAFDRAIQKLKLNEGVDDSRMRVSFHTLRHTNISWAVMGGVPLRTVQELSGHRSLQMLQRYSHLAEDHKKRATMILEKSFIAATENSKDPKIIKIEKA